jgi:DNA-binding SARP family transcriptional activator
MAAAGIIETHFSEMVRFSQMDPWIAALDRVLAQSPTLPGNDAQLSVYASVLIGTLFRQPGHPLLPASVERVWALLDSDADSVRKLTAATFLLVYCVFTGELDSARQVILRGEEIASKEPVSALALGLWAAWQGNYYELVHDLPGGLRVLDRAQALAREHGLPHIEFLSLYFRGLINGLVGRTEAAATALARMEASVDPRRKHLVAIMCSLRGWLAMWQHKPARALQQGKPAFELAVELGSPSYRIHWGMAMVYGMIETGRRNEARRLITEARRGVAGTAIRCWEPFLLCMEARCAELDGDRTACLELVRSMFAHARGSPHGCYLALLRQYLPAYASMALSAGIETDYVCDLIRLAGWPPESPHAENWPWRWKIYTLGRFEVVCDDKPLEFGRKAPKKPLGLLRALIALGETGVSEQDLFDHLWPDEDGDAAPKALATTLHRLRGLLGSPDVIELSNGRLTLDTSRVWVDARAFQALLSEADEACRRADEVRCRELVQRALDLYRGAFLSQDADAPWAISTRERLRRRFIQHVAAMGERWERNQQLEHAIECYQRGLEADDLAEPLYQGLMRCYAGLNRHAEAWSAYRRLRQTLSVTLGIPPSPDSESLARTLLAR